MGDEGKRGPRGDAGSIGPPGPPGEAVKELLFCFINLGELFSRCWLNRAFSCCRELPGIEDFQVLTVCRAQR